MSHHADRGSVASWSRSSTPCPLLAEDCSTNQLAKEPGPSFTPKKPFWHLDPPSLLFFSSQTVGDSSGKRLQGHGCPAAAENTVEGPAEFGMSWLSFFVLQPYQPSKWSHDWDLSSNREHTFISQVIAESLPSTNTEDSNCEPLENAGYNTFILDKEILFFLLISPGAAVEDRDSRHVALWHLICIKCW